MSQYNKTLVKQFQSQGNMVRLIAHTETGRSLVSYEVEFDAMEGAEWYSDIYPVYGLTAAHKKFNELVQLVNTWVLENEMEHA